MDKKFEQLIREKIILLVDFILEKNPNASKDHINHKISKLDFFTSSKKTELSKSKIKREGELKQKIIDSIIKYKPIIKVKRSLFSNYILVMENDNHKFDDLRKNKFVMDIRSRSIIGVENSKGEIEPLDKTLIEICHRYKMKYQIPLNLNTIDEVEQDVVIANEINELGLNYVESEEEEEEEENK